MNPLASGLSFPSSNTSSSSSSSSSPTLQFSDIRRKLGFAAIMTTLTLLAATLSLSTSSPLWRRVPRRQTATFGRNCGSYAEDSRFPIDLDQFEEPEQCDIIGPDTIDVDKFERPKQFSLIKNGSCVVGFVDVYPIVSYEPESNSEYNMFSYRTLADGASVEITIHLAWPIPSASASDRNQYISYKGYASEEDKDSGALPILQKFVKINIVERQPEPLSSDLVSPPTPIYFLDEDSVMGNASCVTKDFNFTVKAMAKLEGINPKLFIEVSVYKQSESGAWDVGVSWSDGGSFRDDWSAILDDTGTTIKMEDYILDPAKMSVDVVNPLVDAYFVFNVIIEDELNWYRGGSAHYIAKKVQKKCDGSPNIET